MNLCNVKRNTHACLVVDRLKTDMSRIVQSLRLQQEMDDIYCFTRVLAENEYREVQESEISIDKAMRQGQQLGPSPLLNSIRWHSSTPQTIERRNICNGSVSLPVKRWIFDSYSNSRTTASSRLPECNDKK